jgi:hypothetical protein
MRKITRREGYTFLSEPEWSHALNSADLQVSFKSRGAIVCSPNRFGFDPKYGEIIKSPDDQIPD